MDYICPWCRHTVNDDDAVNIPPDGSVWHASCKDLHDTKHNPLKTKSPKEPTMQATIGTPYGPLQGATRSIHTDPPVPRAPSAMEMIAELSTLVDRGEREIASLRELRRRLDVLVNGDKPQPADKASDPRGTPSALPLSVLPDALRRQANERDMLLAQVCEMLGLGSVAQG
jgi:hypothetical protein